MIAPARNLRWVAAYWISRVGAGLGRFLPARVWYALSFPLVEVCFVVMKRQREGLIDNLTRVVGPEAAPAVARRGFHNFARYVIDLFQLPAFGQGAIMRRIRFDDWARLNQALDEGNGSLFVTLHLGQAEVGAGGMVAHGHPVNVVAETLFYEPMNDVIQGLRRGFGMEIIPANRARSGVLRSLNRGEVLAMMFDAIEPGERVCVDFFGAPAYVSSASARIALRTGARVLPAVLARDAHDPTRITPFVDYDLKVEPTGDEEADVRAITQAMARAFEGFIRRFPDQWFAFHPVWQQPEAEVKTAAPAPAEETAPWWKVASLSWAVSLGGIVPRPVQYGLAKLLGDFAYTIRKGARADVEDNMRHVLGPSASEAEVRHYARQVFRNVARYFTDLVQLPTMDGDDLLNKRVHLIGLDKMTAYLDQGRGVIVTTAHYGNPEMAVQVSALLHLNVLVLAEPLPPALAKLMQRVRSAFGTRYVDVGFGAIAESLRHLRAGGVLAIAADRDIQGKGVPLPFFGSPTRFPLGAVEMAARTGAVLMPGYCRRVGDGFEVVFEDPIDLVDTGHPKEDSLTNTRALLARFEAWLRMDPGQWMVLDRIWKPIEIEDDRPARPPASPRGQVPSSNGTSNGHAAKPSEPDEETVAAELQ